MWIEERKLANAIGPLILFFLLLGSWYAIALPIFEGADEISHFRVIEFIATEKSLPHIIDDKETVGHEAGQPPLYYVVLAPFIASIDRTDFDAVVRENPHFLHLNSNSVWYHLEPIVGRLYGTNLAVVIGRLISLLMGAFTIWCTWRTAKVILPDNWPELPLLTAGFVAFNPQFLAISASINNDNLVVAFCSLALLLVIRWVNGPPKFSLWMPFSIGTIIGLAVLSKISAIAIGGVIAIVLLHRLLQKGDFWLIIKDGLTLTAGFLLTTGWWFWRNQKLYGDPLGLEALSIAHDGTYREVALTTAETLIESQLLLKTFWLFPGNSTLFGPNWFYWVVNLAVAIGLAGVLTHISISKRQMSVSFLALLTWCVLIFSLLFYWISTVGATSQGRLLYPALSAVSVLLMLGYQQFGTSGRFTAWATVGFLLIFAVITPPFIIQPAFTAPDPIAQNEPIPNSSSSQMLTPGIELLGFEIVNQNLSIGEKPMIRLIWQATSLVPESYYLTLHFVDTAGTEVSRFEGYPFHGQYPTNLWEPNQPFIDEYELPPISDNAVGGLATIFVELTDWRGKESTDNRPLNQRYKIRLPDSEGVKPQVTTNVQFGSLATLTGYTIKQADNINIVLHWAALEPSKVDQTVFVHLIDQDGELVTQGDSQPRRGSYPTSFWEQGEGVIDPHNISLENIESGSYIIAVGFYDPTTGNRLPTTVESQLQPAGFSISIEID